MENEEKKENSKTKSELTTNLQCRKAIQVKEKKTEFSQLKENNKKEEKQKRK